MWQYVPVHDGEVELSRKTIHKCRRDIRILD